MLQAYRFALDPTPAQVRALAFPLGNPAVASVLFGATSPEQLRGNCAAVDLAARLSPQDLAEVRGIGDDQA